MNKDGIIDLAKKTLLEEGNHIPMLHVEFAPTSENPNGSVDVFIIAGDILERFGMTKALWHVGVDAGNNHPGERVICLCLVSEMWKSSRKPDEPRKYAQASQDPDKGEELGICFREIVHTVQIDSMHMFPMIRNLKGKLVEIGEDIHKDEGIKEMKLTMLDNFMKGYQIGQLPKEEQDPLIQRQVLRDLFGI